jgi:hypothetical protein
MLKVKQCLHHNPNDELHTGVEANLQKRKKTLILFADKTATILAGIF